MSTGTGESGKGISATTATLILVIVIVILAIIRIIGWFYHIGLTGAKPLRGLHPWDWILEIITIIIVIALLYIWWTRYKGK